MTKITLKRTENRYQLGITGHAGYAKSGTDIVCAALSILSYSLVEELERLEERRECLLREVSAEAGAVYIDVFSYSASTDIAIETVMSGYRMISEMYDEYVVFV